MYKFSSSNFIDKIWLASIGEPGTHEQVYLTLGRGSMLYLKQHLIEKTMLDISEFSKTYHNPLLWALWPYRMTETCG